MFQRGERAGAETLVFGLQLFEHVETRPFLRLFLNQAIKPLRHPLDFLLNFLQPFLPLFGRATPGLGAPFVGLNGRVKFAQALFQSRAFLFELEFLRGQLFETDEVALLLQIERSDFIAHAAQLLRRRENVRLRLA